MLSNMKIVQLNAWGFRHFEAILEFLKKEKPDIINLQEVEFAHPQRDTKGEVNYFEILKRELKMDGIFAPWKKVDLGGGKFYEFGNAFLTNLEIVDYGVQFEPTLTAFKTVSADDEAFQVMVKNDKSKYYATFDDTKNFIWSTLKYKGQLFRNVTAHYTVSYECTEISQMINQTKSIVSFLENAKPLPTIFTGDLNIHSKSHSIELLSQSLGLVNPNLINTLTPKYHPIFQFHPDSEGRAVDYIFQKGFNVSKWDCLDVAISDHLPVVAELDII
jgi:endonuclease/exonuclease/phosphatase family metal-dependent hydrolase